MRLAVEASAARSTRRAFFIFSLPEFSALKRDRGYGSSSRSTGSVAALTASMARA